MTRRSGCRSCRGSMMVSCWGRAAPPASTSSVIRFSLPTAAAVTLTVFDVSGRQVAIPLRNAFRGPGEHQVIFDTRRLRAGLYVYRLQAGRFTDTRKFVVSH